MASDVAVIREGYISESELTNFELIDGYDVTVIAANGKNFEGLPVEHCWSPESMTGPLTKRSAKIFSSLVYGSSSHMRNLVDALDAYDVVHTVETFHGFSNQAVEAKRRHGIPVVCTVWENIPYFCEPDHYSRTWRERIKHPNAATIKSRVREEADLFLPVTRQAAESLRIEGVDDGRIQIVPIGVDAQRFRPGRLTDSNRNASEFGLAGEQALDVVFVGRYTFSKGVYDLLSAWKRVVQRSDVQVHLTLIGGGQERRQVARYASRADVPSVTVRGPVPYEEVPLIFDAADIAVLPSLPVRHWQEQYGRVILEAQATGTPVAASETGGIPDAMGDVGVLFQPGEPLAIGNALCSLIEDEGRRRSLGEKGRERIEAERTVAHTAEELSSAYDAVR